MRRRPSECLSCLAALLLVGCAGELWKGSSSPISHETMESEFGLMREGLRPEQIAEIREPKHLRPCCAFGSELKVKVGPLPVPGVRLFNTLGLDELGEHEYDGGVPLVGGFDLDALATGERNGLVYTCRGGFVDMAHLRLWADYTLFLAAWVARHAESGGMLEIRKEGGPRRIVLEPVPAELLDRLGLRVFSVKVAQWLAFQMSVWHEIVTWYGWSHLPTFPELASAFSPEDLYSNLIGIKLSGALIYDRNAVTEGTYNDAMTNAIVLVLRELGAQSGELGHDAALHVDGVWWDSKAKLPSKALIRRRNFGVGTVISPWLVSDMDGSLPQALADRCQGTSRHDLWRDDSVGGVAIADLVRLEIDVSDEMLENGFPLEDPGERRVDQRDFPRLAHIVRLENAAEFGTYADRPERDGPSRPPATATPHTGGT